MLLDIGAVWCHWCHVIDRESYENPEIAAMINQFYIPVKVDRDERPDVDARYQSAISAHFRAGRLAAHRIPHSGRQAVLRRHVFPARRRHGPARIQTHPARDFRSVQIAPRGRGRSPPMRLAEAVAKAEMFHGARGEFDSRVVDSVIDSASSRSSIRATEDSATRRNFRMRPRSICCSSGINRRGAPELLQVAAATLEDGARRRLRPDRRRVSSLLGGRALVRPALRENVLRQFRAAEKFSARLSGHGRAALSRSR